MTKSYSLYAESAHILGKLLAAQQMEVDVLDRLTAILTNICDNSVAIFKPASLGNFGNCLEYCLNTARVFGGYSVGGFDVTFGNDKHVNGSLGSDVLEGIDLFVLIYLCGGDLSRDYFTEQARHFYSPFSKKTLQIRLHVL